MEDFRFIMTVLDSILEVTFLGVGLWAGVVKEDWNRGAFWVSLSIVARL